MSPLLGTLGSAWMLLWGIAAVVPILIHLLSRRTRAATHWAAMEFLYAAVRKNARRLRLEQWLLLALRASILILIALAWSEPSVSWLSSNLPVPTAMGQSHTVLVLDGSYSMECKAGGQQRWRRAQQLARQMVANSASGDGFSLLLMADPPREIITDVAFDRNDVQREIGNLAPTQGSAALLRTLEEAERMVRQAKTRHARLRRHRVCVFTDLGRNTWDAALTSEGRRIARDLARLGTLVLIDVAGRDEPNLAVTHLSMNRDWCVVGDPVTFEVAVSSFGNSAPTSVSVELLLGENRLAEQLVNVPAAGRSITTFSHTWDTPGEHSVTARIRTDSLERDNVRHLSVPVRERVNVLCVEGEQDAARCLALALSPGQEGRGRMRVETAAESALVERNLRDFDCVWLCDVGRFGRQETNLLHQYVVGGGALISALGDQTQPENHNQELGGEASGRRVLPARLHNVVADGMHRFDPIDYSHPMLDAFRDHPRSGLLTAPTWRYISLAPHKNTARVALRFEGGDPAIVEESIGRGTSILLATSVSLRSSDPSTQPPTLWTALPTWPVFPPLVHAMTQFAVRGRHFGRNVLVGQPLVTSDLPDIPFDVAIVTTPDRRSERVPVRDEGAERTCVFSDTRKSGVYRMQFQGSDMNESHLFSVNIHTAESDLSRVDRDRLPAAWRERMDEGTARLAAQTTGDRWPLFRLLLVSVFLLLLAETALAWRLGGSPG